MLKVISLLVPICLLYGDERCEQLCNLHIGVNIVVGDSVQLTLCSAVTSFLRETT
jgi:hypothetical protein